MYLNIPLGLGIKYILTSTSVYSILLVEKREVSGREGINGFPGFPVVVACVKNNPITLAAVSFFSFNPPMVMIGIIKSRYLYELINDTNDFTLNIPRIGQIEKVHYIGTMSGRDVDKFKETGLTPIKGRYVSSSMIKEFPVSLECRVVHTIDLGGNHIWFVGEILTAYIEEDYDRSQGIIYWAREYRKIGEIHAKWVRALELEFV